MTPKFVATSIFRTDAKVIKLVDLYQTKQKSMAYIAGVFETSITSVRKALVANGVKIRGQGRVAGVSPARLAN